MKLTVLALRGLRHYWRTQLATVLGLATAASVLGGAWAVGDSVRASLRDLALSRIGRTTSALVSNQFFREQLAPEAPIIALEGAVTHDSTGRRASRVAIYGVDRRFFEFHQVAQQEPRAGEALLSPGLAAELGVSPDDTLLIRIPRISAIPAESLHGTRDDPGQTLRARFTAVAARQAMGEFSLRPVQGEVRAVFLPLPRLQRELNVHGRVNTALLRQAMDLRRQYQLEDVGLHRRGEMLQSESIVFSDPLVDAVKKADPGARPVLSYLGNTFRVRDREVPYSLLTAVDRDDLPDEGSIVLNEWMRRELSASVGDEVSISYYLWDPAGQLSTHSASFRVSGFTPIRAEDQELAPEYPGISGSASMSDWNPPFPLNLKAIRPQDEAYWNQYRATPKAFIRLTAGQKLWRSKYGAVTSIRLSPAFEHEKLRRSLDPEIAGLTQVPVRQQALAASAGSTNFGEYFLYFSSFLIFSALLLSGLFFRFGLEQRAQEIATLRALGFSRGALMQLFLTEGLALAAVAGPLSVAGAALYGTLILTGLQTWWIDAVGTRYLSFHLSPVAVLLSLITSLLVGLVVVGFGVWSVTRRTVREVSPGTRSRSLLYAAISACAAVALLFAGGPGGFFGAGALFLAAALALVSWWLRHTRQGAGTVTGLGIHYAAHRPGRSTLCIALIAGSAFLVVSVEAFRRHTAGDPLPWRYYGETALPVYHDPNTAAGKEALNLPATPVASWLPLRLRPGDDASCLNLYAPRNPRVLGVPSSLLTLPATGDGTIAAAVDANTLEYVLHRKPGSEIEVGGARLRIVKALPDSIFQSEILISDRDFQAAFPDQGGFRVFLVNTAEGKEGALEAALADYGLDLTSTAARLATFHRVENTYLSTFQALGGLGLVLGTIGLGAVLMRNIFERRRELGLLQAVGFRPSDLARMTLAESLFLTTTGLAIGVVCALAAVLPVTLKRGGSIPVWSVLALTAAVILTSLLSTFAAARLLQRTPLLAALRSE